MKTSTTRGRLKTVFTRVAAVLFWLAVWQLAYAAVSRELLLVSPARALAHLLVRVRELAFWLSVGATLFRVVAGFLLALLAGTCLAALCVRFKAAEALVAPLLGVVRATPVASIIILLILWLNADILPLFVAFLMVLPVIWANVYEGICAVDADLLEMAGLFRIPRRRVFSAIYIPALAPYFVSASSSGLGIAWKSAIATEVLSLPREAIGRQIYNARIYLETPELFAWTIAVVVLSLLLERLTTRLFRRLALKRGSGK